MMTCSYFNISKIVFLTGTATLCLQYVLLESTRYAGTVYLLRRGVGTELVSRRTLHYVMLHYVTLRTRKSGQRDVEVEILF